MKRRDVTPDATYAIAFIGLLLTGVLQGACATGPTAAPTTAAATPSAGAPLATGAPRAEGEAFTGEVWTWDEHDGTVTLRQGFETVRVKISRDQLRGLRLYQQVTVRGTRAPKEIETVVKSAPTNYAVVPRGPADQAEVVGRVGNLDPAGIALIDSARGSLQVWVAPGVTQLRIGDDVRLHLRVQPVDVVAPERAAQVGATPATPDPSTLVSSEPGDYAVITGRVMVVDQSGGRLSVESPRGPVDLWLPDVTRYRVDDMVQVRTSVHAAKK